MPPKAKPEYSSDWIHHWFRTICKRFGWMVIASEYEGNELKIAAYLEEINQLKHELTKLKTKDRDAAIMLKKLNIIAKHGGAILR